MRFHVFASLVLVGVAACAPPPVDELGSNTQALLPVSDDEEELRESFDDAAFYCESYLLQPLRDARVGNVNPFRAVPELCATGCADDSRMTDYADSDRMALSHNSPHGPGTPFIRTINTQALVDQERRTNGCADAVDASGPAPASARTSPSPGLCRADFNHCIAQQLQLKADSLARPPSSRSARAAILHEARARFALAADEHTRTLAWIDDTRNAACTEFETVWQWDPVSDATRRTAPKQHHFSHPTTAMSCPPGPEGCQCPGTDGGWDCRICQIWLSTCQARGRQMAANACEAQRIQDRTTLSNFVLNPPSPPKHTTGQACLDDASYTRPIPAAAQADVQRSIVYGPISAAGATFSKSVTCTFTETHADGFVQRCAGALNEREKNRVAQGYGVLALERVNDALSQIYSATEDEVTSLLGDSEALPVHDATRDGTYGAAVWGAASPRMEAARVLVGVHEDALADLRFADWPIPDDRARVALQLIVEARAPLPYSAQLVRDGAGTPTGVTAVSWPRPADAALASTAARTHEALARHLAERARTSIEHGREMLAADYRVDVAAVASALRLLDDQLRTLEMDFVFVAPSGVDSAATTVEPAVQLNMSIALQRSKRALVSTLTPAQTTLAGLTSSSVERLGTAGAVHFVRERLLELGQRNGLRSWNSEPRLQSAVAFIDRLVGAEWSSSVRTARSVGSRQTVRLFTPNGTATRSYFYTHDADIASCLRFGHQPGSSSTTCRNVLQATSAVTTGTVLGRRFEEVSFDLPAFAIPTPVSVVQRSCVQTQCSDKIVAVVMSDRSQVHVVGGEVDRLLYNVLAKSPSNPALPQTNALGVNTGFVPALRSLDSLNSDIADFHMRRLKRAEDAVTLASSGTDQARALEQNYILNQAQHVEAGERARAGARAEVEDACSGRPETGMEPCEVRRRPRVTLAQLGLVQVPLNIPNTMSGQSCANYTLALTLPDGGDADTIEETLRDALRCEHWRAKQHAADTILVDVPEAVISALVTPVPRGQSGPSFAEYGGKLQAEMAAFYQALVDVRHGFEDFESGHAIAQDSLTTVMDNMDDLDADEFKMWQCRIGLTLKAVATVVAAIYSAEVAAIAAAAEAGAAAASEGGMSGGEAFNLVMGTVQTVQAIQRCDDADEDGQEDFARRAYFDVARAIDTMQSAGHAADRMNTVTALADNGLDAIARSVRQARERIDLEDRISALDPVLASPIWRRMRGASATRARLDTETAQRRLYEARRAIEYRTASDITNVNVVVNDRIPASWSGELFALPSFEPEQALLDYHRQLQGFVEGYADAYNFNDVREFAESLSLGGVLTDELEGQSLPLMEHLWFKCRNAPDLLLGGHSGSETGEPCASLGGVDYATVSFAIPPGLGAYLRSMLPGSRVNQTFEQLVVNFRGTSFRDCERATNRNACYVTQKLEFSLHQQAQTMLENLDGELHMFDLRPGSILDAPGLAAEVALTDLAARQIIDRQPDLRRKELSGRPLIGNYSLLVRGRPELVWSNLEDVELQLNYAAWAAPAGQHVPVPVPAPTPPVTEPPVDTTPKPGKPLPCVCVQAPCSCDGGGGGGGGGGEAM